uniref:Uncharacterized protein n=2 Tax=Parascaris univalens TaxID=6257 RepID=A0A915C635_PARUN
MALHRDRSSCINAASMTRFFTGVLVMTSTLALSLVCLAVFSAMIGIASLGLALFVVLRDRLFPLNASMLPSKAHQFQRQSEDTQPMSTMNASGNDKISRKNEQLYAINDGDIIDLDDAGLIKMSRLRVPRGTQLKIDETAFITDNGDVIDEMTSKSSQHPSDGEHERIVDDVEMPQNSSYDNDKLSDDPIMKREDQFLKDSESMSNSESSPNKLTTEKRVVPLNIDPKEDLEMKDADKDQHTATMMTTAKTSGSTIITEVTFTIEPPFEKVIVEPLCSTSTFSYLLDIFGYLLGTFNYLLGTFSYLLGAFSYPLGTSSYQLGTFSYLSAMSTMNASGSDKISRKNEQLYAINDGDIIDLDDAGLIKMSRSRVPRGTQLKIDETAFITDNGDVIDEMTSKSSQHPSDGEHEKIVDDVEMPQNSSYDNDKLSNDPIMKREHQFLKDSESMSNSERSPNKLTTEMRVVPLNIDPKEDLEMKDADKDQHTATMMTTAKTSGSTIITEVTLTIEPPFEKVIVEPLCSTTIYWVLPAIYWVLPAIYWVLPAIYWVLSAIYRVLSIGYLQLSVGELLVVLLIDEVTSPVLLQCNALKTRNTLLRHRWCIVRRCSKLRKVKKPRRALLISKNSLQLLIMSVFMANFYVTIIFGVYFGISGTNGIIEEHFGSFRQDCSRQERSYKEQKITACDELQKFLLALDTAAVCEIIMDAVKRSSEKYPEEKTMILRAFGPASLNFIGEVMVAVKKQLDTNDSPTVLIPLLDICLAVAQYFPAVFKKSFDVSSITELYTLFVLKIGLRGDVVDFTVGWVCGPDQPKSVVDKCNQMLTDCGHFGIGRLLKRVRYSRWLAYGGIARECYRAFLRTTSDIKKRYEDGCDITCPSDSVDVVNVPQAHPIIVPLLRGKLLDAVDSYRYPGHLTIIYDRLFGQIACQSALLKHIIAPEVGEVFASMADVLWCSLQVVFDNMSHEMTASVVEMVIGPEGAVQGLIYGSKEVLHAVIDLYGKLLTPKALPTLQAAYHCVRSELSDTLAKLLLIDDEMSSDTSIDNGNWMEDTIATIYTSSMGDESTNLDYISKWRWALAQVAQYCIENRLRTPLGKPADTFLKLENEIRRLALSSLTHKPSGANGDSAANVRAEVLEKDEPTPKCLTVTRSRRGVAREDDEDSEADTNREPRQLSSAEQWWRVRALLETIELLDKLMSFACDGALFPLCILSQTSQQFFMTNEATCSGWMSRMYLMTMAVAYGNGHYEHVLRLGAGALRDAKKRIASAGHICAVGDGQTTDEKDLHPEMMDAAAHTCISWMVRSLVEMGRPQPIMGIYSWAKKVYRLRFQWIKYAADMAAGRIETALDGLVNCANDTKQPENVRKTIRHLIITALSRIRNPEEMIRVWRALDGSHNNEENLSTTPKGFDDFVWSKSFIATKLW